MPLNSTSRHRFLFKKSSLYTALCLLLVTPGVFAGGLEVPDLGTTAMGRGTAFAARADNPSAFYYNPAGLTKGKGLSLLLGATFVHMTVDYLRTGSLSGELVDLNGDGEGDVLNPGLDYGPPRDIFADEPPRAYQPVSLQTNVGSIPLPLFVFNWGNAFDVEGLSIAAGIITPSSFGAPGYPDQGAQRYAIRQAHFLLAYPGVGVAYAINRYLQLGAVFLSGVAMFEQNQAIRLLIQTNDTQKYNEDFGGDADLRVEAADWFIPTGLVGVMSHPLDWLELGLTVKAPAYIEAEGTVHYTAPELAFEHSELQDGRDKITLSQHFPWVVRFGARYIHQLFDVELDFVWENWSSLSGFDLELDAAIDEQGDDVDIIELPDTAVPKNFRDTFSVRLGGDVDVMPEHLSVRAGGYWQSSAYPEDYSTFSLDFPFAQQFGLSAGLTWHTYDFLKVNVGYLHVFQLDVEVKNGIVQQQGKPRELVDGTMEFIGNTVNNGRYEVAMNFFSLSLEGQF